MPKGNRIVRRLVPCAVAGTLLLTACGGGGEQGRSSSSGGGTAAVGAAVIGLGLWIGKSLLESAREEASVPAAALESLSLRIGAPSSFTTSGNLGYVVLNRATPFVERNLQMCKRFLGAIQHAPTRREQTSNSSTPAKTHITAWPIQANSGSIDQTDCAQLITRYDYDFSAKLLNRLSPDNAYGPFLVSYVHTTQNAPVTIFDRAVLIWNLTPIAVDDFPLVLRAWAMMQTLSVEELKKALSEPSVDQTVERIAGITASRVYERKDIKIALKEQ